MDAQLIGAVHWLHNVKIVLTFINKYGHLPDRAKAASVSMDLRIREHKSSHVKNYRSET